jgi:hypothetical protein
LWTGTYIPLYTALYPWNLHLHCCDNLHHKNIAKHVYKLANERHCTLRKYGEPEGRQQQTLEKGIGNMPRRNRKETIKYPWNV